METPLALRTFRDPDGYCFTLGEHILRIVYPHAADRVRALIGSPLVRQLISDGTMPATRILEKEEIANRLHEADDKGKVETGSLVLEHQRIRFVSYPHEWCPEMLYAAGQLTLEIQLRALDEGLTLKDATPANVLFSGSRPVFVDLLSLEPIPQGMAVWVAYAQFIRTFLLPLLRYRKKGISSHEIFLSRRDGLEPEEVYRELSGISLFSPLALQFVSLPTWLGKSKKADEVSPSTTRRMDSERAHAISRMLVKGLARSFRKVRPPAASGSTWSDYMETNSYERDAFTTKESFVRESLNEFAPESVIDIGCNTGHFSKIATALGATVVALDYDTAVVGSVFNRAKAENLPILPLVMNLSRPSPALGWDNREQPSFISRAKGQFDVGLMLAVIHHLTVTDGIPLPEVFRLVSHLVTRGLIVEFVPPSDPMFRKIIRNKEHLEAKLQKNDFEAGFSPWFSIMRNIPMPKSGRILYCLKKRTEIECPAY